MKKPEKDPVSDQAEKSITESAQPPAERRARELREFVDEAPPGGTYRAEQGRDERRPAPGEADGKAAPAASRSGPSNS